MRSRLFWILAFTYLSPACETLSSTISALINDKNGTHTGGFPSHEETHRMLDDLVQWNPMFSGKLLLGISYQCRPMFGYWVAGIAAVDEKRSGRRLQSLRDLFADSILDEEGDWLRDRCLADPSADPAIRNLVHRRKLQPSVTPKWPPTGRMILTAVHHAREPSSLTATLYSYTYILGQLAAWWQGSTKNFVKNPYTPNDNEVPNRIIPSMMLNREVLFLPFVNPDGYVAIENSGNKLIRKNQRPTCTNETGFHVLGLNGVDLNRNYDSYWEAHHSKCDAEEHEGSGPFSESETRTVRRMAQIFSPHVGLNFHSFGDFWTRPFNCCREKKLNSTARAVFKEIESVIQVKGFGSAPELPALDYTSSGEADDYLMEKFGVISMSPEVGQESGGFYPNAKLTRQSNEENNPRTLRVLLKAGPELSATLFDASCFSGDSSTTDDGAKKRVIRIFNSGLTTTGPIAVSLNFMATKGHTSSKKANLPTVAFFISGQTDKFISTANQTSDAVVKLPDRVTFQGAPMDQRRENYFETIIADGLAPREAVELKFEIAANDLPQGVEVCTSSNIEHTPGSVSRPDLVQSIMEAQCLCGFLALSTEKGAECPVDQDALHFAPVIPAAHICLDRQTDFE